MAEQGTVLEGEFSLSAMPRLASMLSNAEGQVVIHLAADVDDEGIHYLAGSLETTVTATCQRCMEPLAMPLQVESRLGLIRDESEANVLPDAYDPLVVPGTNASLVEIVEDELILALPFSPRCADPTVCGRAPAMPGPSEASSNNPFEALSVLLSESKRKE